MREQRREQLQFFKPYRLTYSCVRGNRCAPIATTNRLRFFMARTLQMGYSIAILSLLTLYLISLFASRYVGVLLPIVLTISLLSPSFLYSRLDRRAAIDE